MRTAFFAASSTVRATLSLILLGVLGSAGRAEVPQVSVSTLDGRNVEGQIQTLTADSLVLKTNSGDETLAVSDLLGVTPRQAPQPPANRPVGRVELSDGSILVADGYTMAGGTGKFPFQGQEIALSTRSIAAVRLQEPTPAIDEQWRKIRSDGKIAGDLVLIRKGDAVDYVEGVIVAADAENVELELDGSKIPVKRTRVDGLIYLHRQAAATPDPLAMVYLGDDSRLAARSLSASDTGLEVETTARLKASVPWDQVRRLDFSAGKIQYLNVALGAVDGALLPDEEKVTEFLQLKTPFAAVQEFYRPRSNGWGVRRPLKLAGEIYERGLAIRSRTELLYRIRGKYRRFQAVVGIDDSVAGQSNDLRLTITGDGRPLFDELIRGTDGPRQLDLNIEGVSRLDIKVDYGDDGLDAADLLNLCDARVTK